METIIAFAAIIAVPASIFGYRKYMPRRERHANIEQAILEMLFHSKHPMHSAMIYSRVRKNGLGDLTWDEFQKALTKVAKTDEVFNWMSANSGGANRVYQHTAFCVEMHRLAA